MATAVKTRSELGASNLSKGKAWMYDFAKWMRAAGGFPSFEVIAQFLCPRCRAGVYRARHIRAI